MPPSFSSTRSTASECAIRAGWVFSVRVSSSAGPSNIRCDSFWRQGFVHFLEHLARGGEGGGEVAAHADGLAALAGKDEGVDGHPSRCSQMAIL